jgi:hypothetical protein
MRSACPSSSMASTTRVFRSGLFYFPGYAKFTAVTPENASHALAGYEFGAWTLANFATPSMRCAKR